MPRPLNGQDSIGITTCCEGNSSSIRSIQSGRVDQFPEALSTTIETIKLWEKATEERENRAFAAFAITEYLLDKKAIRLSLDGQGLTSLPDVFGDKEFDRLKALDVSKNLIKELPPTFLELKSLEVALLADNLLFHLPKGISTLDSLKGLDVSHNAFLTEFPSTLPKDCILKAACTGINGEELKRIGRLHVIYRS